MNRSNTARKVAKAILGLVLTEESYGRLQSEVMARDIRRGRYYEPEVSLIGQAVERGDCAVDVGANYGLYTYHLSRSVGASGTVIAFEPIPFTVTALRRVVRILDLTNVSIYPIGCGEDSGIVEFSVPIQSNGRPIAGLSHIAARNDERPSMAARLRYERRSLIKCQVARLDDLVPSDARVTFIKVDVEGAELAVLRGALRTLSRCAPTIVCEVNPGLMDGFGYTTEQLLRFVEDLGYSAFWYNHPNLVHPYLKGSVPPNNWIFVHHRRKESLASLISDD